MEQNLPATRCASAAGTEKRPTERRKGPWRHCWATPTTAGHGASSFEKTWVCFPKEEASSQQKNGSYEIIYQRSQKLRNSSFTQKSELIPWILAFLRVSPLFLAPHGDSSTPPGFLAPHSRTTSAFSRPISAFSRSKSGCLFSPARNLNFSGSAFERCKNFHTSDKNERNSEK